MRSPKTTPWHPAAWQSKPAQQQPKYADSKLLERVVADLARLPPIVVSWEVDALLDRLAQAQRGQAFLLQGGDCAEAFSECQSDQITKQLKILLQMSMVLLHGFKKPIIRVGRMAGQYAKPRSTGYRDARRRHACPATAAISSTGRSSRPRRARPIPNCCCAAMSVRR